MQNAALAIGEFVIQQDAHGRYSLNDLHRAAGGEKRHQPSDFLRKKMLPRLIAEIRRQQAPIAPVEVVNGGPDRGTYVCRELVYAYAMWVSPAFFLLVIRTFDAIVGGFPAELEPRTSSHRPFTIYFIQQGNNGPVKVGRSCDVSSRMASLQTANPVPLRLLATVPEDETLTEASVHQRFCHIRLEGEWFEPTHELRGFIESLRN